MLISHRTSHQCHNIPLTSLRFLGPQTLAISSSDGSLGVYSIKKHRFLNHQQAHDGPITALETTSHSVCTGGEDGVVKLSRTTLTSSDLIATTTFPNPSPVVNITLGSSRTGVPEHLAVTYPDSCAVFDVNHSSPVFTLNSFINDLSFQAVDPHILVSAEQEGLIRLWDIRTADCVSTLSTPSSQPILSVVSCGSSIIAGARSDGIMCWWDRRYSDGWTCTLLNMPPRHLKDHLPARARSSWCPTKNMLVSACGSSLRVWDTSSTVQPICHLDSIHGACLTDALVFTGNNGGMKGGHCQVFTSGSDGRIILWSIRSPEEEGESDNDWRGSGNYTECFTIIPREKEIDFLVFDGETLLSVSRSGGFETWVMKRINDSLVDSAASALVGETRRPLHKLPEAAKVPPDTTVSIDDEVESILDEFAISTTEPVTTVIDDLLDGLDDGDDVEGLFNELASFSLHYINLTLSNCSNQLPLLINHTEPTEGVLFAALLYE